LLDENGGVTGLQIKVKQATSATPLLEVVETEKLDALVHLVTQAGSVEALEHRVDQAASATPLLEVVETEKLGALVAIIKRRGGLNVVDEAMGELEEIARTLFDYFNEVESGLDEAYDGFGVAWGQKVEAEGFKGKVASHIRAVLANECTLAAKVREQRASGDKVAEDVDRYRKQCVVLLDRIESYKLEITDKEEAIELYRRYIQA
jgi:hypothetical protein